MSRPVELDRLLTQLVLKEAAVAVLMTQIAQLHRAVKLRARIEAEEAAALNCATESVVERRAAAG